MNERDASRPPEAADPEGWAALARQLEADQQLRAHLEASGIDLGRPTVQLMAHLQALRERLQALRDTAAATARLAGRARQPAEGNDQ